jgi:hypothetical protein
MPHTGFIPGEGGNDESGKTELRRQWWEQGDHGDGEEGDRDKGFRNGSSSIVWRGGLDLERVGFQNFMWPWQG